MFSLKFYVVDVTGSLPVVALRQSVLLEVRDMKTRKAR